MNWLDSILEFNFLRAVTDSVGKLKSTVTCRLS